ncbi:hypothetical protein D3C86_1737630 [compost metagenome]
MAWQRVDEEGQRVGCIQTERGGVDGQIHVPERRSARHGHYSWPMKVETPGKVRGSGRQHVMDRQVPGPGRYERSRNGDPRAARAYQRHALAFDRMPLRTQPMNKAESVKVIGRPRPIRLAPQHIG